MPLIRSLAFKCCAYIIVTILSLDEIMPIYFHCTKKKLVYIMITALFNYQPSSYIKCTKLNIHSSYNVRSVSNAECI